MKIILYPIVLTLCLMSAESLSLSCKPYVERVIGQCSQESCDKILFVEDIRSVGACGRRPIVSSAPSWAKLWLEKELEENPDFVGEKVFELTVLKGLRKFYEENKEYFEIEAVPRRDLSQLKIIDDKNFLEIKNEWQEEEKVSFQEMVFTRIVGWAVFIFSLILLIWSIKWFREVLLKNRKKRYIAGFLIIQGILFGLKL